MQQKKQRRGLINCCLIRKCQRRFKYGSRIAFPWPKSPPAPSYPCGQRLASLEDTSLVNQNLGNAASILGRDTDLFRFDPPVTGGDVVRQVALLLQPLTAPRVAMTTTPTARFMMCIYRLCRLENSRRGAAHQKGMVRMRTGPALPTASFSLPACPGRIPGCNGDGRIFCRACPGRYVRPSGRARAPGRSRPGLGETDPCR